MDTPSVEDLADSLNKLGIDHRRFFFLKENYEEFRKYNEMLERNYPRLIKSPKSPSKKTTESEEIDIKALEKSTKKLNKCEKQLKEKDRKLRETEEKLKKTMEELEQVKKDLEKNRISKEEGKKLQEEREDLQEDKENLKENLKELEEIEKELENRENELDENKKQLESSRKSFEVELKKKKMELEKIKREIGEIEEIEREKKLMRKTESAPTHSKPCIKDFITDDPKNTIRFPAFFGTPILYELGYIGKFFPVVEETREEAEKSKIVFFIAEPVVHDNKLSLPLIHGHRGTQYEDFRQFKSTVAKAIIFVIPEEKKLNFTNESYYWDEVRTFVFKYRTQLHVQGWEFNQPWWVEDRKTRSYFFGFVKKYYTEHTYTSHFNPPYAYVKDRDFFPLFLENMYDNPSLTNVKSIVDEITSDPYFKKRLSFNNRTEIQNLEFDESGVPFIDVSGSDMSLVKTFLRFKKYSPLFFFNGEEKVDSTIKKFAGLIDYFGADLPYTTLILIPKDKHRKDCKLFINHVPLSVIYIETDEDNSVIRESLTNSLEKLKRIIREDMEERAKVYNYSRGPSLLPLDKFFFK